MVSSAGAVEYTDCISVEKWGSSNVEALGNGEFPFIAFALRSTLAWNGSTW